MDATAGLLLEAHGKEIVRTLQAHTSETARGWAASIAQWTKEADAKGTAYIVKRTQGSFK